MLSPSGQVTGDWVVVTLNNYQNWIIYSSTEVTWKSDRSSLTASGSLPHKFNRISGRIVSFFVVATTHPENNIFSQNNES